MRKAFLQSRVGPALHDLIASPELRVAVKYAFAGVLGADRLRELAEHPAARDVDVPR